MSLIAFKASCPIVYAETTDSTTHEAPVNLDLYYSNNYKTQTCSSNFCANILHLVGKLNPLVCNETTICSVTIEALSVVFHIPCQI